MSHEYLLFLGALVSEIAWTIAGFGSSSTFLPIAHQFLTYENALILVAIYHIFGNISRFSLFWRAWDKKIFFLFGIPSIIATVIWAELAWRVDPSILKIALWIVLSCFAIFSLWKPDVKVTVTPWIGRAGGALSWFSAGLIGTGGVIRGAFMTLFWLTKEAYIATIASVALLVDATRIPLYFWQWFLDPSYLWMIPVLFVIAFIGSTIGKCIVKRVETSVLRKIILWAIVVMSLFLAWQGRMSI